MAEIGEPARKEPLTIPVPWREPAPVKEPSPQPATPIPVP